LINGNTNPKHADLLKAIDCFFCQGGKPATQKKCYGRENNTIFLKALFIFFSFVRRKVSPVVKRCGRHIFTPHSLRSFETQRTRRENCRHLPTNKKLPSLCPLCLSGERSISICSDHPQQTQTRLRNLLQFRAHLNSASNALDRYLG
jgi:hypothetical protein